MLMPPAHLPMPFMVNVASPIMSVCTRARARANGRGRLDPHFAARAAGLFHQVVTCWDSYHGTALRLPDSGAYVGDSQQQLPRLFRRRHP